MSTYNLTIAFTPVSYLIKLSEKEFGYFYEEEEEEEEKKLGFCTCLLVLSVDSLIG